ncbi:hypothetical protein ACFQX6_44840 [Streptosporangium lutulentum]
MVLDDRAVEALRRLPHGDHEDEVEEDLQRGDRPARLMWITAGRRAGMPSRPAG